jgi:pyruvate dehydrogenase phosphatase
LHFFSVYDGHAGAQTSQRLSADLIPYVKKELDRVFEAAPEYIAASMEHDPSYLAGRTSRFWDYLSGRRAAEADSNNLSSSGLLKDLDAHPQVVQLALRNAFRKLDSDIVNTPIRLLAEYELATRDKNKGERSADDVGQALQKALEPAISGACAMLSYIDVARNKSVFPLFSFLLSFLLAPY